MLELSEKVFRMRIFLQAGKRHEPTTLRATVKLNAVAAPPSSGGNISMLVPVRDVSAPSPKLLRQFNCLPFSKYGGIWFLRRLQPKPY
jgi:hypothetical protein